MPETGASHASPNHGLLPLQVEELTYRVDERLLVGPVSFELDSPGVTMILGFNGAGKSLLLRLLHGMIAPTGGHIRWSGRPLCEPVRRRQAMVFQKPVLLRRSVAANIDFALRLRGSAARADRDERLREVGLADLAGLAARRLSGGEQQRLALARAMATRPEVLFLDEPTANLDPASVLLIEKIVSGLEAGGTKVILVSHDIAQARRLANDVLFLHRGVVAEYGPAKTFFSRPTSPEARAYLRGELLA